MIKNIPSILFYANNISQTEQFYATLGFPITHDKNMLAITVGSFTMNFIDKASAAINKEADREPKGLGMFVYVEVDNIDEYYRTITKKGIAPSSEPRDWPWGNREFALKDPNGYTLVFFNKLTN